MLQTLLMPQVLLDADVSGVTDDGDGADANDAVVDTTATAVAIAATDRAAFIHLPAVSYTADAILTLSISHNTETACRTNSTSRARPHVNWGS